MTEGQLRRRDRKRQARDRLRRGFVAADPTTGGLRVREQRAARRRKSQRYQSRLAERRAGRKRGGRLASRLAPHKPRQIGLGTMTNQVLAGPGSSRQGKKAKIVYQGGAFYHDYGGSIGRIRIRRSNPLTKRYTQLLAAKRANSRLSSGRDRIRQRRRRPRQAGSTPGPNAY